MSSILAIDPGNIESAYALLESKTFKPIEFGKIGNYTLRDKISDLYQAHNIEKTVIEVIESYGMTVGKSIFDTCIWIGRYTEVGMYAGGSVHYMPRKTVKMNLCGSMKAKDSNIRVALVDRFAQFDYKTGKGTKKNQDFFFGFANDVWSAMAIGVTYLDQVGRGEIPA